MLRNLFTKKELLATAIVGLLIGTLIVIPTTLQLHIANAAGPSNSMSPNLEQKLNQAHQILTQKMILKQTQDIPVFLSAVNYTSNELDVGISDTAPLSLDIYRARLVSLLGDIPMHVGTGHFTRDSCTSQTSQCSPLEGGIEIQSNGGLQQTGTLNSGVINTGGSQGVIISSHVADDSCAGNTGQTIYQPTVASGRSIGTVLINSPTNGRLSDSAYVTLSTGVTFNPNILASGTHYYLARTLQSSEVSVGTTIYMAGYKSLLTSGTLKGQNISVSDPFCGTLVQQDYGDYSSQGGDSGAPVFSLDSLNDAQLLGIHVGTFTINGSPGHVYSPWQGLRTELSISNGITIYATEQSTGNYVNGLFVTVNDINNNVVGSGYTPLFVPLSSSGTYYVNYDNYGSYYFTNTPSVPTTAGYNVYSWGGKVQISYTIGDQINVKGVYYNDNNPGSYAKITYKAYATSCSCDPSMFGGFRDSAGNLISQGYSPFTVGIPISQQITTYWNNYGTHTIQGVTTNVDSSNLVWPPQSWGTTQTITVNTAGGSKNYYDQGNFS